MFNSNIFSKSIHLNFPIPTHRCASHLRALSCLKTWENFERSGYFNRLRHHDLYMVWTFRHKWVLQQRRLIMAYRVPVHESYFRGLFKHGRYFHALSLHFFHLNLAWSPCRVEHIDGSAPRFKPILRCIDDPRPYLVYLNLWAYTFICFSHQMHFLLQPTHSRFLLPLIFQ